MPWAAPVTKQTRPPSPNEMLLFDAVFRAEGMGSEEGGAAGAAIGARRRVLMPAS